MSALLWAIAFVWVGIGLYIVTPILMVPSLSRARRNAVANHYFKMAMLVLDRALLIARRHGGYSLVPSSYDASLESEKVKLGDETLHFEDPYEFTTSLHNRRFALADEERNVIINPRLAELGERFFDFYHEGEHEVPVEDPDGRESVAFTSVFSIPKHPRMVNLREAKWMIPGSSSPKIVEVGLDYVEKSQLAYKSRNYVDLMIGLMAFGLGFALPVASAWLGITGGGSPEIPGVSIGLWLGWF